MKFTSIAFLLLCTCCTMYSQKKLIGKVWVGENFEHFKLDGNYAMYMFMNDNKMRITDADECNVGTKKYLLLGDTLRLIDEYYRTDDSLLESHYSYYNFKVVFKKDSLTLKTIDDNAYKLAAQRNEIHFWPIDKALPKKFEFDSLRFSSTMCFGDCPEMDYTIKGRNIFFKGGYYAIKQGKYTTVLSKKLYRQLVKKLNESAFFSLDSYCSTWSTDAPSYTIWLSHNQKIKMDHFGNDPFILYNLAKYLLEIPKKLEKKWKPQD